MARKQNHQLSTSTYEQRSTSCEPPASELYAFEKIIDLDDPSLLECGEPQHQLEPVLPQQQLTKPQECNTQEEVYSVSTKSLFPKDQDEIQPSALGYGMHGPSTDRIQLKHTFPLSLKWTLIHCSTGWTRFILEIRRKNGKEYPSNTLYHVVCFIMRFLRQNGNPQLDSSRTASFLTSVLP